MRLTDPLWTGKWSKNRFSPPIDDFSAAIQRHAEARGFGQFGTDEEPGSSLWLASLSEAVADSFREGMAVLDYGCGAGRYAQFLRQRLAHFTYFGLEKPGSNFGHGEKSVAVAEELFRGDGRVSFGLIGGPLEARALARADVVVLGSIFTHVDFSELRHVLSKLQPIVARGGRVVFSIFIADTHHLEQPGAYGFADCYGRAWFTTEQLQRLCDENEWTATERESFVAQEVNVHRIFALTRKTDVASAG
jgi:SAM-dependent methyltransferase